MQRLTIPSFLTDLAAEPRAIRALVAASAAIGAAGLNPTVFSPGYPSVQAALRSEPDVEILLLLATLIGAGLLFVGGILSDSDGRRGILLGALALLVVTGLLGLVATEGPIFLTSRLAGTAAANAVVPFALALVATMYHGITRATAIGIVYAVYGGAVALAPVLVTLLGPGGSTWPAFAVAAAAAAVALWIAAPRTPDLPAMLRHERSYVVATAVWAFAIVIVTSGIVGTGNGVNDPVRVALIGIGAVMAAGYLVWARKRGGEPEAGHLHVERRAVTIAVAVGLVIGFAQAGPLFQLTLFFNIVLRYGTLGATVATAPFIVALIVAGPVAGMLLVRYSPRALISGGLAAVGMGNVVAALVLGPQAPYIAMALSFALIGTGFVITTTVRTAIIFASVPRGLPGTAAALNQASVQVGSRIGLVVLTVVTTRLALDAFGSSLGAADPGQRDAAVAAFADVLKAIGTPAMGPIALTIAPNDLTAYSAAFTDALRQALLGTGLVTLVAAPIAWAMLGRRDPLTTVWDHSDERTGSASMFGG